MGKNLLSQSRNHQGIGAIIGLWCSMGMLAVAQVAPPQDAEEDIRGPRALVEIPQPEQTSYFWWWIAAGLLLGIALGCWAYRHWRQRRVAELPQAVALRQLQRLVQSGTVTSATEFAEQAAMVLRQYFTDRFGIAAPRRTSEEFLRELAARPGAWDQKIVTIDAFLRSCDLAKFAGLTLADGERQQLVDRACEVVQASEIVPSVVNDSKKEVSL